MLRLVETTPFYLHRIIEECEDCFAQAQRAAALKDWRKFKKLMEDHQNLCSQWRELIT